MLAALVVLVPSVRAEDLVGTVGINRRLTKPRVSAVVPLYERGPAVGASSGAALDPLAAERERVVIYIEGPGPEVAQEGPVQSMQQLNRSFVPETVVVPVGGKVSFPNMDPIFHNVFSLSKPKSFDLGNYTKGNTRVVTFPTAGVVYVNCHLHTNMGGVVFVTPNAWSARADADGKFTIHGLPPGEYTVVAWHKAAGYFRDRVTVVAGKGGRADFLIPLEGSPDAGGRAGAGEVRSKN